MKIKTSNLIGRALAWAVGTAEGCMVEAWHTKSVAILFPNAPRAVPWNPHLDWAQGGPIIEQACICLDHWNEENPWKADISADYEQYGPTPLIAAMRCYVASKLGDVVDIPEELS